MARTALFVIDIQHALAGDPATEIPHAARITAAGEAILRKTRAAIDAARTESQQQQPPPPSIFIVQHEESAEDGSLNRGTQAWELVFRPREYDAEERVVAKTTRDAFESNPQLASELKAQEVGDIVAFGIQSECCVLSTCRGALKAGFGVTLLKGAHSTYHTRDKKAIDIERAVEAELKGLGAKVIEWEMWEPR